MKSQQNFSYIFSCKIYESFSVVRKKSHTFLLWNKDYIETCSGNQEIKQCIITISCGYRNSSISKTELFVITVNDWKWLTIFRSCPSLNVGGFLELSLGHANFADFVQFFICKVSLYICYMFITYTLMNIFYINIRFFELTIFQKHNY